MNYGGGFWSVLRVANRIFCIIHYRLFNSASISSDGMLRCRSLELAAKLAAYLGTDLHKTTRGLSGCKIEVLSIGKQTGGTIAKLVVGPENLILAGPNLPLRSCNEPHTLKNGVTVAARSNAGITMRRARLSPPSRGLVPNRCWRQLHPMMVETYLPCTYLAASYHLTKQRACKSKRTCASLPLYPRNAFDPVPQLENG